MHAIISIARRSAVSYAYPLYSPKFALAVFTLDRDREWTILPDPPFCGIKWSLAF